MFVYTSNTAQSYAKTRFATAAGVASDADLIVALVNANLARIERVLVTFTPEFLDRINQLVLVNGRPASSVIKNARDHADHFHIDVRQ